MIIVAALEAVALVLIVFLLLRHFRTTEQAWAEERRELVNRIQAPDRIPVAPSPDFAIPALDEDEWNSVGSVTIDPDFEG